MYMVKSLNQSNKDILWSNLFFFRNGKQRGEAALFGFRLLRVRAGAAPVPPRAARRGFSAAACHDGCGGAAAQGPAGLPVEMSTGTF